MRCINPLRRSPSEARLIGAEAFVLKAALARAPLGTWFVVESPTAAGGGTLAPMTAPRRLVIGEDDVLLCEGIERVLAVGGFEVAARDAVEIGRRRVHAILTTLRES